MSDEWIVVPNWDKFQSYTDRDPPWIKLWTGLGSNPDWDGLSLAARGMLTTIWVEYARSRGQLPRGKVMQVCGKSARSEHLESLNHAGFVHFSANKPAAREEKRREEKKEEPTKKKSEQSTTAKASCPTCGVSLAGPRMLAEHLYLSHDGPEPAHWAEAEAKAELG